MGASRLTDYLNRRGRRGRDDSSFHLSLNPKWVVVALTFLFVLLQLKLWNGEGSYTEVRQLREAISSQKVENERLRERNAALEAEVDDLKVGLDATEERARSELGMIKRDETFFQVIDNTPAAAPSRNEAR